ncbi:MAG: alpha/beta hydrolase [Candidatus Marisimplicoccus sp.]
MLKINLFLLILFSFTAISQEKIPIYNKDLPCYQNNEDKIAYEGENIIYTEIKDPEVWYYPSESKIENNPAVIVIPGGGYGQLSIESEGTQIAEWLNQIGIDAFVLKHRLPANYEGSCKQRVAIEDGQAAINFIRDNSIKFKINPNKLGVMGFSAGGHLASSLSNLKTNDSRPNFSVLLYPVITMNPKKTNSWTFSSLFGESATEGMILRFSNELNVDKNTPPTIIIHSDNDVDVIPENSISYYMALRKNNIPTALHIWEDGGHGYGLGKGRGSIESWPKIVEEWMKVRNIID